MPLARTRLRPRLQHWRGHFLDNGPQVAATGFDDTFHRLWEFYLAYWEAVSDPATSTCSNWA